MKKFAVIFDINGTLIDTEKAHFEGYREALRPFGIKMTIEEFTDTWSRQGKKLNDFLEQIGRHELVPDFEAIKRKKDDIFQATLSQRIALMPGAKEILQLLADAHIPLGLDTSGSGENMEMMLSLFGLTEFFNHVANGDTKIDEGKYGSRKWKASRLKYLADLFGLPPDHCVMVGDAEKDLQGAKDAGMRVIAIPNIYTRTQDFSVADAMHESLKNLTVESFSCLI
ncbi:MAG: HAD family phosphatase [Candidatus Peribacteraceae bacterium]|nr:HAD family phosphatase [Candidatus Peribacteraceae bacterium]